VISWTRRVNPSRLATIKTMVSQRPRKVRKVDSTVAFLG